MKTYKTLIASNDFELWHRRLGHICDSNLRKVMGNGIECINGDLSRKCEVRIKGKQTRMPIKDIGHRTTNLLEIVHSDVMGPISTKSFSGNRFLLTFVDDCSRKVFVVSNTF